MTEWYVVLLALQIANFVVVVLIYVSGGKERQRLLDRIMAGDYHVYKNSESRDKARKAKGSPLENIRKKHNDAMIDKYTEI